MTANATFLDLLADAIQRPVEVSPVLEATTLGAAYLAGLSLGTWADEEEVAQAWVPQRIVEPTRRVNRERWFAARARAEQAVPELSSLEF
jgi:glycerol kinase